MNKADRIELLIKELERVDRFVLDNKLQDSYEYFMCKRYMEELLTRIQMLVLEMRQEGHNVSLDIKLA